MARGLTFSSFAHSVSTAPSSMRSTVCVSTASAPAAVHFLATCTVAQPRHGYRAPYASCKAGAELTARYAERQATKQQKQRRQLQHLFNLQCGARNQHQLGTLTGVSFCNRCALSSTAHKTWLRLRLARTVSFLHQRRVLHLPPCARRTKHGYSSYVHHDDSRLRLGPSVAPRHGWRR